MPAPPPVTSAVLPSRLIIEPVPQRIVCFGREYSAARHFGMAPQAEDLALGRDVCAPIDLPRIPAIFDVEARRRLDIARDHQVVAVPTHIDRNRRAVLSAAVDAAAQIVE